MPPLVHHRPLAYFLRSQGFEVSLISSLSAARTREALFNSRDKNDPKDSEILLRLLKQGVMQTYYDPLWEGFHDIQVAIMLDRSLTCSGG